mmetsp:Transcript_4829/g.17832  ORF Transcript_4829/g.17832 Transcript_4829/m.17832 type:complete len:366 (+) Transcript_4829:1141-2238(+)
MLFMCVGMLASVPMPCFSILEIKSDSVNEPGGDVVPSVSSTLCTWMTSPTRISRSGTSAGALHGIASVHPVSRVSLPETSNCSPRTSRTTFLALVTKSLEHAATNRRATKSYRRHASIPPTSSGHVAQQVGVMGGWSPWSTPPRGFRNRGGPVVAVLLLPVVTASPSILATMDSPISGCFRHCVRLSTKLNPSGNALDSVRGYEMNPAMYRRSATCMAWCAPMFIPAEADFRRSTVFNPGGGGFFVAVVVQSVTVARVVPWSVPAAAFEPFVVPTPFVPLVPAIKSLYMDAMASSKTLARRQWIDGRCAALLSFFNSLLVCDEGTLSTSSSPSPSSHRISTPQNGSATNLAISSCRSTANPKVGV